MDRRAAGSHVSHTKAFVSHAEVSRSGMGLPEHAVNTSLVASRAAVLAAHGSGKPIPDRGAT
jgi:hypothetical protein